MQNSGNQYPQQRMKLAPNAHQNKISVSNNHSSHGTNQNSYYKSQMARMYCTQTAEETLWMVKERQKENDPDANSPTRSCDNTINTNTESKYDDEELEAAIEAFAWFKGEQRATTEANRLRTELSDARAEIERLNKYVDTVTTDMSDLQIEIQRSEDRNSATSPMAPLASSDQLEELSRTHAHAEAMWLKEKKEISAEVAHLRSEVQRQRVTEEAAAEERPHTDDLRALRETVATLREEKEVLQNREDAIRFQLKRDYSSEIDQLQAQLHDARETEQSSNVHTVEELNRLQSNHDVALAELENLREELKLAQEESSWLRSDKVIAEEGAQVTAKIAAAAEVVRQRELLEAKEQGARLAEELDQARLQLAAAVAVVIPPPKGKEDEEGKEDENEEASPVTSLSSAGGTSPVRGTGGHGTEEQTPVAVAQGSYTALYNLSVLLQSEGKLAEAVPHCREALLAMRAALGSDHADTLHCVNTLATILYGLGEYTAAEPLAFECYRGMSALFGLRHDSTLTSLVNLAILLQSLKKLDEAEPFFRDFFEKREGLLPDTHPDSLRAMNNYSLLLQSQGKCAEAEPFCRRSLECMRGELGELHPDTLQSISNLAMLLYGQGKLEAAEPYCYEALSGMRTTLGNSHMSTLASVSNLAMMLQGQRKLESAEPYCREALAGMRSTLGNTHSITLASVSNLAMLLYNRENYEEAEALYREAFETMRDTLGADDPQTLSAMSNLGMLLQSRGQGDVAAELFRECLTRRQHVLGDTHPDAIKSLNCLACLLQSLGRITEAEEIYRESFVLVKQRAEASAAVEVERLKEQLSVSEGSATGSQSGRSDDFSGSGSLRGGDLYANYDEEGLILKGTLSSSTLNSSCDSESRLDNSSVPPSLLHNHFSRRQADPMSGAAENSGRYKHTSSPSPSPSNNHPSYHNNNYNHTDCSASQHSQHSSSMLSSTSSTARLLMLHSSQSPKQSHPSAAFPSSSSASRKKQPLPVSASGTIIPMQLIKCAHDKCRKKFTSRERYILHLQAEHKDSDEVIAGLLKRKEEEESSAVNSSQTNSTLINNKHNPNPVALEAYGTKANVDDNVYFGCNYENCPHLFKNVIDRNTHEREAHMGDDDDNCNTSISSISSNSTGTGTCTSPLPPRAFLDGGHPPLPPSLLQTNNKCPDKSCQKTFKSTKDRNNHMKDAHGLVMLRSGVPAPLSPAPGLSLFSSPPRPPGLTQQEGAAPSFSGENAVHQTQAQAQAQMINKGLNTSGGSKQSSQSQTQSQAQSQGRGSRHVCPFAGCTKQCRSDAGLIDHIKNTHTGAQVQQQPQQQPPQPQQYRPDTYAQKTQRSPDAQKSGSHISSVSNNSNSNSNSNIINKSINR